MNKGIERNIQRIQKLGLSCSINDNGKIRHFHNGHEYIEMGGIKWATMNVGADKPTDSGLYFAWGEIVGYTAEQINKEEKTFGWADYKYGTSMTKYNNDDGKMILDSSDDAVTANWGKGWKTPTYEDFIRLIKTTHQRLISTNYVNGCLFTDIEDESKSLFFPLTGFGCEKRVAGEIEGIYLSSVLRDILTPFHLRLREMMSIVFLESSCFRCRGFAIRGVVTE